MNPDPDFKISATPYLCVHDAAAALDFYAKAFGAVETLRMAEPSGKIGHAEFHIGGAQFMLASEFPEIGVLSPKTLGGSPVLIVLDLPDVDAFAATATAAGAAVTREIKDQFYGRRSGQITDPFGHRWDIGTTIEEVSQEELTRRAAAMRG